MRAAFDRRRLLFGGAAAALTFAARRAAAQDAAPKPKPNFVVIFADDMGYGDVGCFGHPTIRTPHLDRMAAEGAKLTQFYVAASVCTPSRAGLLTGRLPIRSGMCSSKRAVLFPDSKGGLPQSENTIAKLLKGAGYATACVGKWHLGHLPEFLPTRHGFDSYFGIPYSNDMDRVKRKISQRNPPYTNYRCPLIRDEEEIERPTDQRALQQRYAAESVQFIERSAADGKPFFLYFAHNMPHIPLFRSEKFVDRSKRGFYGDVIEEIDDTVGQVMAALERTGQAENTLLIFTSDNGPWLTYGDHGGSAGLLRDGKGSTWEGGMRVPCLAWQPGKIAPRTIVDDMTSSLDLLPTFCALAGVTPPDDRVYDGADIGPALFDGQPSPRDTMFYYRGTQLRAARQGPWKLHRFTKTEYRSQKIQAHNPPLLFNVEVDPGEQYNVQKDHPAIVERLQKLIAEHEASLESVESHLEKR